MNDTLKKSLIIIAIGAIGYGVTSLVNSAVAEALKSSGSANRVGPLPNTLATLADGRSYWFTGTNWMELVTRQELNDAKEKATLDCLIYYADFHKRTGIGVLTPDNYDTNEPPAWIKFWTKDSISFTHKPTCPVFERGVWVIRFTE